MPGKETVRIDYEQYLCRRRHRDVAVAGVLYNCDSPHHRAVDFLGSAQSPPAQSHARYPAHLSPGSDGCLPQTAAKPEPPYRPHLSRSPGN